ncbi:MAG: hypothetical protein WAV21_02560 [Minisyncoccia bacterium]
MGIVVPAILPSSRLDLEEKLQRLSGLTDFVQIDVVDGRFATPPTWPYSEGVEGANTFLSEAENGTTLPGWGEFKFDIDLMVSDPDRVMGGWISEGASRITVHAESSHFLSKAVDEIEMHYGHGKDFAVDLLSFGLALNIGTDLALIEPFISHIEYVQFMGIRAIGRQGEPFDMHVLERVKTFRKKHPDIQIQVDGGVSLVTAPPLLDAGVDRLVVGSALWKAPDLKAELEKFNALTEQYGLYE